MSPLPKRKKTAEELAELRKSLGIPGEAPAADEAAKEERPEWELPPTEKKEPSTSPPFAELSAFEDKQEETKPGKSELTADGEAVKIRPQRSDCSMRKSAKNPYDRPKKKERPESGKLPSSRHSDEQIRKMQKDTLLGGTIAEVKRRDAGWLTILALYLLGGLVLLAGAGGILASRVPPGEISQHWLQSLALKENFGTMVHMVLCAGAVLYLLASLWFTVCRPLSRHHAAIMTIIAVLVLVFSTLYFFPQLHGA